MMRPGPLLLIVVGVWLLFQAVGGGLAGRLLALRGDA